MTAFLYFYGTVQTDATLLDVTCCVRLHILLYVLGCCCVLMRKVWNWSKFSANNSEHFFCSVIAEAERNNVGSVCTALPTLLGPRTLITHLLQRLMSCILPTMHCRSNTCWELLHPFASVSQHCWRNNVRSCCARLHAAYSARSVAHVCKTLVCGHAFRNLRTFS